MASRNAQLAEAVKAALNAAPNGTFNQAFKAKRVCVPVLNPDDIKTLTVSVIAAGDESDRTARDVDEHQLLVLIGIEKRISSPNPAFEAANPEIDQLLELVEQVNDFFHDATVNASIALFVNSTIRVLCDVPTMLTQKLFRGIVAVNYLKPVG